jgi:3-phosphoshikimate 1-carboxyvinyltransferase
VGALGVEATIIMEGRLPERPLSPLQEIMNWSGCYIKQTGNTIKCYGKLTQKHYRIDGSVSSQFISGLMFAHWIMGNCTLEITGQLESRPYIEMTKDALTRFDSFRSPGIIEVEGDWSNGAFWLAARSLGNEIQLSGLDENSKQGDKAVMDLIQKLRSGHATIDAKDIPDLVPILSVVAAANHGATFTNIRRLRLKESDRVASTIAMLESLGGNATATENTLTVLPCRFTGGVVDSMNDHRIAMSAAIAATVCGKPVTIIGAECVKKSYPGFWEEYARLGGNYEKQLR